MSEQKFKESKSSLALSQALIDRMRAEQMPQEEPVTEETGQPQGMGPEAPQEEVAETPTEAPTEEPVAEQGESRLERMFSEFMETVNNLFKREQEQEPDKQEAPKVE